MATYGDFNLAQGGVHRDSSITTCDVNRAASNEAAAMYRHLPSRLRSVIVPASDADDERSLQKDVFVEWRPIVHGCLDGFAATCSADFPAS
jgi:hypothetical protein